MVRKLRTLIAGVALAALLAIGSATAQDAPQTIVDVAASNPDFSTLVTAVTEAGLVDTLNSEGPFTVFAPTNEAFAALPEGQLDALLANKEQLAAVLTYHVGAGKVMAADVVNLTSATSVQGEPITITVSADGVKVNDANVTATDIEASNGVIHVIDKVILPPSMIMGSAGN
ncbi:MAG: fasciclin domain-containing protein [Deinococcales bacterium]